MTEIKTLRNYAFRWLLTALLSVMFVVLLGGYWRHIHSVDNKLNDRTAPLENITQTILSQSGSSDDSLTLSTLAQREALISGLDLTPSVSNDLRHYITNLYTVAGAFDAAKNSLPQTNDREYLFDRGTINLLQTNSLLSGDVLALYSGRETIKEAIDYLSGALMSTTNGTKKQMSSHNLSVAMASQIGVEVLVCTKSYDALAQSWNSIGSLFSGIQESYIRQLGLIDGLRTNDAALIQCLTQYRQTITSNLQGIRTAAPTIAKLTALSLSRQRAYNADPLQCPIGIDLYDDIVALRGYESDLKVLTLQNNAFETAIATGNINAIQQACAAAQNSTGGNSISAMLDALTGSQQQMAQPTTGQTENTGSYITLPEDTQKIINDIYQNNIRYIDTMQKAEQSKQYRPFQRLQQLFKEFYGDSSEFIK